MGKELYRYNLGTTKKEMLKTGTSLYSLFAYGEKLYGFAGYGKYVEFYELDDKGVPAKTLWEKEGLSFKTAEVQITSKLLGKYVIFMLDNSMLGIYDISTGSIIR